MVNKKANGKRGKTRRKLKAKRGKPTINKLLQDIKRGSRVKVVIDPSLHSGMPHKSYHGAPGVVAEKQGKLYAVDVKKGSLQKRLLVHSGHLQVVK